MDIILPSHTIYFDRPACSHCLHKYGFFICSVLIFILSLQKPHLVLWTPNVTLLMHYNESLGGGLFGGTLHDIEESHFSERSPIFGGERLSPCTGGVCGNHGSESLISEKAPEA